MASSRYDHAVDRIEELRYLVLAAQREGSRRLTEALAPLGISPAQAEVLTVLAASSAPVSIRELGELLVCETGSPSRLARAVVARGWAEAVADDADGRVTRLRLTAQGRTLVTAVGEVEAAFHTELADAVGRSSSDLTLENAVTLLRTVVGDGPAGRALARRRGETP